MFKTERMDAILGILREKKHVTVHYLAERIYASEVTIRRDLHKMEELGLIIRSYGGVTLRVSENVSVPLVIREQNLSSVKNRIAEEAAQLIRDGDTVLMDGSSTVLCMVRYFRERQNMTVITNSLRVATLLCEKHIPVYCTGGLLVPEALVCVGSFSNNMLESITADCMFFSSQGFSTEGRVCDFSENETCQRKLMLQHARRKYFLCDSSKLGKSFLFTVCHMNELDRILCDTDVGAWLRTQATGESAGGNPA